MSEAEQRVARVRELSHFIDGQRARTGELRIAFHIQRGAARLFSRQIQVAWWASTCRVRCRWREIRGWKRSLFGDHHAYRQEAVRFYTRYKSVIQHWPDSIASGAEFAMPVAK
jgi:malonate-semialdehyde dehydrogenase (acetylating) / methylmalonate-semialdehyde dehydrogenase